MANTRDRGNCGKNNQPRLPPTKQREKIMSRRTIRRTEQSGDSDQIEFEGLENLLLYNGPPLD